MDNEKISIVVTYLPVDEEIKELTAKCIRRLISNTVNKFELILVCNNSIDIPVLGANTTIVNYDNLGNGRAWDQGVAVATGDILVMMDNDVLVEPNWDVEMIDRLSNNQIGITFPYSVLGILRDDQERNYTGKRDGFCFAFKRETYNKVGPFLCDQPFKLGYYEDDHFEARVQYVLGLKLVACPNSRVWHKGQGTTKKLWNETIAKGIEENRLWYEKKWNGKYPYLSN